MGTIRTKNRIEKLESRVIVTESPAETARRGMAKAIERIRRKLTPAQQIEEDQQEIEDYLAKAEDKTLRWGERQMDRSFAQLTHRRIERLRKRQAELERRFDG
jgi:hypothetical protein